MDAFRNQCARRHFMLDKPLKSLPCSGHQMQTHLLHTNVSLGSQRDGCWARDHNTLPPAQTLEDEAFHLPGLREVRSLHLIPLQQKPPQLSAGVDHVFPFPRSSSCKKIPFSFTPYYNIFFLPHLCIAFFLHQAALLHLLHFWGVKEELCMVQ